jgi:hypothetical protein
METLKYLHDRRKEHIPMMLIMVELVFAWTPIIMATPQKLKNYDSQN